MLCERARRQQFKHSAPICGCCALPLSSVGGNIDWLTTASQQFALWCVSLICVCLSCPAVAVMQTEVVFFFFQTTEAQYPLATCQDWTSCISLIICSCAESEGAMVPKGEIPGQWSRGFTSWSEICLLDGLLLVEPERLIPLLEADYYVFVLPFFHLIDLKDSV